MTKDKRLGRGLAALLGSEDNQGQDYPRVHTGTSDDGPDVVHPSDTSEPPAEQIVLLSVDEVEPNPFQPRRSFGQSEIDSLAESLKEHEQLQPILVREVAGRFQLISGERRWRAKREGRKARQEFPRCYSGRRTHRLRPPGTLVFANQTEAAVTRVGGGPLDVLLGVEQPRLGDPALEQLVPGRRLA